ncbi:HAMP domain-containing sensor histidine kinase [Curvibacter sp. APW13]|uniref:sensor histidine kinase n=1 Tax=Curvibacter sp. APW13 TaxID=3077236 RepID=UPI0028DD4CC0|nr:HAMP domain-containing sensor histidine kinase [Curvibacter sp. APW13]MDT8992288.1 HAMP domain-containing sensor histidine kinase [Curvibacter sp. APW13]
MTSPNRRYVVRLALGAAAMAIAVGVLLVAEMRQQQSLEKRLAFQLDSITAPATECERQFLIFLHTLESTLYSTRPPEPEVLGLRYDLFLSRLTLLREHPGMAVLASSEEYSRAMPRLEAWVLAADPVMSRPLRQRAELLDLLDQTRALAGDVHAVNLATTSAVAHLIESQGQAELAQLRQIEWLTVALLVMVLGAFAGLSLRHRRLVQEERERRRITEDLRQAHALAQSAMEKLQQSQEQLARSETKAALNTIIASVSHELSSPLGNNLLMASTLAEQSRHFRQQLDSNQLKRSELIEFVQNAEEGSALMQRNLQRATEQLRQFRQVANDQASEQRRSFDLLETVQEVLGTLAPSLRRFDHRITVDIATGITMDSYPGPLGQVVINLVNNAYLHAFEGKVQGNLRISSQQLPERDAVLLLFEDDGVGMSEDTLAQLFHPFFSTKAGQGGTGLGMMIVADLVRKTLGGDIDVHSTVGRGTQIALTLPLHAPAPRS